MSELTSISMSNLTTVGIDIGDKYSHYCELDLSGKMEAEGRIRTTHAWLSKQFGGRDRMRVAIETGCHSPWICDLLQGLGHEVILANARSLRAIYSNPRKSDRVDARMLARLARMDPELLNPVTPRSAPVRAHLAILRARACLVEQRTNGALHLLPVAVETHESHARGTALIDSMLKAGRSVRVRADEARAGSQKINLLNQLYRILRDAPAAERTDVLGASSSRSADDSEAREWIGPVDLDIPATRAVLSDAIKCRAMRGDSVGFTETGLEVGPRPDCRHGSGQAQHILKSRYLRPAPIKIPAHTSPQVYALADVYGSSHGVSELVDAGRLGKVARDPVRYRRGARRHETYLSGYVREPKG